jgi:hypothetical protein
MSAAEIIEQIKALSPSEKEEVREFVQHLDLEKQTSDARTMDNPTFEKSAKAVFEKHSELLKKLAS